MKYHSNTYYPIVLSNSVNDYGIKINIFRRDSLFNLDFNLFIIEMHLSSFDLILYNLFFLVKMFIYKYTHK